MDGLGQEEASVIGPLMMRAAPREGKLQISTICSNCIEHGAVQMKDRARTQALPMTRVEQVMQALRERFSAFQCFAVQSSQGLRNIAACDGAGGAAGMKRLRPSITV
ncbi:hypothetical protein AB4Y33_29280, partial [Paraburkholderia sp. BR14319]|uniref:hypothetical protein n=1 Tax=Paraburkholderia sp. BR14319 TaxID=3237005 RepID=UPI0034D350E2